MIQCPIDHVAAHPVADGHKRVGYKQSEEEILFYLTSNRFLWGFLWWWRWYRAPSFDGKATNFPFEDQGGELGERALCIIEVTLQVSVLDWWSWLWSINWLIGNAVGVGCWILSYTYMGGRRSSEFSCEMRGACGDNGYKSSVNGYKNGYGGTTSVGIPIK